MAAAYMTAAQVGSYFVTQYYRMLQQRPDFVHQLYSDASTMIRIDGRNGETCAGMMYVAVPNYMMGGAIQAREYMDVAGTKENGTADNYGLPEQRLQQLQEPKSSVKENTVKQADGYREGSVDSVQEVPPPTFEGICWRASKAPLYLYLPLSSSNKNMVPASECHYVQQNHQSNNQQFQQSSASSAVNGSLGVEADEEVPVMDDRGGIKSVYVRGLPPTLSASEIEEEFKKFGKLRPGGVAIRSVKDTDVCYAFVEFEDIAGVQNAIQVATLQVCGHQLDIEERRANSSFACGRRGRGWGNYQPESSRSRFGGRGFGRRGDSSYRQKNR